MKCQNCGREVDEEFDICPFCGRVLYKKKCPRCGKICPVNAIFCSGCGNQFTPEQEKKINDEILRREKEAGRQRQRLEEMAVSKTASYSENDQDVKTAPYVYADPGPDRRYYDKNTADNYGRKSQDGEGVHKKKNNAAKIVLIITGTAVMCACAAAALFFYHNARDISSFRDYYEKFRQLPDEYIIDAYRDEYDGYIKDAKKVIKDKNKNESEKLESKMKAFESKIKSSNDKVSEYKKVYDGIDERFEKYIMDDGTADELASLKEKLKKSVGEADVNKCKALSGDIDDLESIARTESIKAVKVVRDEVAEMDSYYLDERQKKEFDEVRSNAEELYDEGNYSEARDKYTECLNYESEIEEAENTADEESGLYADTDENEDQTYDTSGQDSKKNKDKYNGGNDNTGLPSGSRPSVQTSNGFIFENSDSEVLERSQYKDLSDQDLQFAIDEIYARHGYKFKNNPYKKYYKKMSWYKGKYSDQDKVHSLFNDIEIKNSDKLAKERDSRK